MRVPYYAQNVQIVDLTVIMVTKIVDGLDQSPQPGLRNVQPYKCSSLLEVNVLEFVSY